MDQQKNPSWNWTIIYVYYSTGQRICPVPFLFCTEVWLGFQGVHRQFGKRRKKLKKVRKRGWHLEIRVLFYQSCPVRTGRQGKNQKVFWKTWEKFLTKAFRCVILIKLLLMPSGSAVKKLWKKYLTNEMKFGMISKLRRTRRVPCKLNNVTKRKHQTDVILKRIITKKLPSTRLSQLRGTVTIKMKLWQIAR